MISMIREVGEVSFPEFTGERVYMHPFTQREGLPTNLSRWQPTVDAMLLGIKAPGPIYLMIDQGEVAPQTPHRRTGPHIDGNWVDSIRSHGGDPRPPGHSPRPTHASGQYQAVNGVWRSEDFSPEALILASNLEACLAYEGEFEGDPKEGGDCSHLNLDKAKVIPLKAGRAYSGNVTMIHESIPLPFGGKRTLVRLNVPAIAI